MRTAALRRHSAQVYFLYVLLGGSSGQEDIYLHGYSNPVELRRGLEKYFGFYNSRRLHQSLDYMTRLKPTQ